MTLRQVIVLSRPMSRCQMVAGIVAALVWAVAARADAFSALATSLWASLATDLRVLASSVAVSPASRSRSADPLSFAPCAVIVATPLRHSETAIDRRLLHLRLLLCIVLFAAALTRSPTLVRVKAHGSRIDRKLPLCTCDLNASRSATFCPGAVRSLPR